MTRREHQLAADRAYFNRLLRKHHGNVKHVAAEAGLARLNVYRILQRCGADSPDRYRRAAARHHAAQVRAGQQPRMSMG